MNERDALAVIEAVWERAGYPRSRLDGAAGFTPGWHARKRHRRPSLYVEVVGYDEDEADRVTTALARIAHLRGWRVEVLRPTLFEVTPRRVDPGYIPRGNLTYVSTHLPGRKHGNPNMEH